MADDTDKPGTEPPRSLKDERDEANAALDRSSKVLEYRTKKLGVVIAVLGIVAGVLGLAAFFFNDKAGNQSEDNDALRGRIDSLERRNGDLAEQVQSLEAEAAALRTQRDDAMSDLEAAAAEPEASATPAPGTGAGATDGGETRQFTLPWSSSGQGTGLDLDEGVVGDNYGGDIRFREQSGQPAIVVAFGQAISLELEAPDPGRAACEVAVDRRPLAQDAVWGSPAAGAQACISSDYGVSRLTVESVADNGDLRLVQVYWLND